MRSRYRIGIPDRSCAIIFPVTTTELGGASPEVVVANMYAGATIPLYDRLINADDLEIMVAAAN
jgi:hypothetical protein